MQRLSLLLSDRFHLTQRLFPDESGGEASAESWCDDAFYCHKLRFALVFKTPGVIEGWCEGLFKDYNAFIVI